MTSAPRCSIDFSTDPDVLLREDAAAMFLGYSARTLQDWRREGGGPEFVRVSCRSIRYRRRDLTAWSAARVRASTSDDESCWSPARRAATAAARNRTSTSDTGIAAEHAR